MCSWKYFPNKKGLLSGITVCGFSLGPLFFSFLAQKIVNPGDASPSEVSVGAIKDHFFGPVVYNNVT